MPISTILKLYLNIFFFHVTQNKTDLKKLKNKTRLAGGEKQKRAPSLF